MAALAEYIPAVLLLGTSSALGSPSIAQTWSHERTAIVTGEALARCHSSNLPSIQAQCNRDEVAEFSALPLVAVQTIRVRFRDVGMLPPMSLEDEIDVDE